MIKLENISKNYGDHIIFDNMSITFDEENSLNGIIGKAEVEKQHCSIYCLV